MLDDKYLFEIWQICKKEKITISQLADTLGISRQYLSDILKGKIDSKKMGAKLMSWLGEQKKKAEE